MDSKPAYRNLPPRELRRRATHALAMLADCRACPRDCCVNRLDDKWSACKTGRYAVVNSYFPHFGEEDCLRGWNGSGTIFFSHCNLRCVFCQNFDISQAVKPGPTKHAGLRGASNAHHAPRGSLPGEIAEMMLQLQRLGCHNINFVTPEHVVPEILEALVEAVEQGLDLPLVYNTSGYDSLESLRLMDGVVDVYMPDFKCWTKESSKTYLKAENYPEAARAALREMHRQVGPLILDERGLARRGVLIRHLFMPGGLEETRAILGWIASELGPESYVNLMNQYRPVGRVSEIRYSEINRRLTAGEFLEAQAIAMDLGLRLDER